VVLDNDYSPSSGMVIVKAFWQAVAFPGVDPGASSDKLQTVSASPNTAWVLASPPSGVPLLLQSRDGFGVHLDETLHIPVDDDHFAGNCAAGSTLSQLDADFMTSRVFAADFAGLAYDAPTCTVSSLP
jgi:hypothetical protein